jgi:hypothetical protein
MPSLSVSALCQQYEETGSCGSAANFFKPPLANLTQRPTARRTPSTACPLAAAPTAQPHPYQGFAAIDEAGQACLVTYIYGASQAMALLAPSSKTPVDPQSLDLPSMGALVVFYHACAGFPVKQPWLDAIKAGNFDTFDGLTYSNAERY